MNHTQKLVYLVWQHINEERKFQAKVFPFPSKVNNMTQNVHHCFLLKPINNIIYFIHELNSIQIKF